MHAFHFLILNCLLVKKIILFLRCFTFLKRSLFGCLRKLILFRIVLTRYKKKKQLLFEKIIVIRLEKYKFVRYNFENEKIKRTRDVEYYIDCCMFHIEGAASVEWQQGSWCLKESQQSILNEEIGVVFLEKMNLRFPVVGMVRMGRRVSTGGEEDWRAVRNSVRSCNINFFQLLCVDILYYHRLLPFLNLFSYTSHLSSSWKHFVSFVLTLHSSFNTKSVSEKRK